MAQRAAGDVRFFTIQQIAEQIGVSDKTVRRWIAAGGL